MIILILKVDYQIISKVIKTLFLLVKRTYDTIYKAIVL